MGAMLGRFELAGDQMTVPAENRLALGNTGDLGEELPPKPFANVSERAPLGVGEPDVAWQVRAEYPILNHEVFALEKEALVHQTCHIREQPRPSIVLHAQSI